MTKSERQRKLMNTLRQRRYDTIVRLSQEYGMTRQTIMRDLDELCEDLPTVTIRGRAGGVKVMEGLSEQKCLSEKQVQLLKSLMDRASETEKKGLEEIIQEFFPLRK